MNNKCIEQAGLSSTTLVIYYNVSSQSYIVLPTPKELLNKEKPRLRSHAHNKYVVKPVPAQG